MVRARSFLSATASLFALALVGHAQSCQERWIPTFGAMEGTSGPVHALCSFDSGSGAELYAGGEIYQAGGVTANNLARWDGTRWRAVLGGPAWPVKALCVFDDGSGPALYIGGIAAPGIARWNGTTLTYIVGVNGGVNALTVHDDGTGPALYAGGTFTTAGGAAASNIAKWNGTSWSALGTGVNGAVYSFTTYDDGGGPALVAGGQFFHAGGVLTYGLAQWRAGAWSGFGATSIVGVHALAVYPTTAGPLLVAGGTFSNLGPYLSAWNGTSWSALGSGPNGPNGSVHALRVFDDGTGPVLWVGGYFSSMNGLTTDRSARWNGSSWSSTSGWVSGTIRAFAPHDPGSGVTMFAAGDPLSPSPASARTVAQWGGGAWRGLTNGLSGQVNEAFAHDFGSGMELFVGGTFLTVGGIDAYSVARWNGLSWSALGSGLNDIVHALAAFDDGSGPALYAGGRFSGSAGAAGIGIPRIARYSNGAWSGMGLGMGMNSDVYALTTFTDASGTTLIAAGTFTTADLMPAPYIAHWNGTSWEALGGGLGGGVETLAVFDSGSGPELYAGGWFTTTAGGGSALHIARWNGSAWNSVGGGMNGRVSCLAVHDDGTGAALYAGGQFTLAGGVSAARVARWNGSSWSAVGAGVNAHVRSLASVDAGNGARLYAGGDFSSAGGAPAEHLASWNGSSWSPLGAGVDGAVLALTGFDGGACNGIALIAGGLFRTAPDSGDGFLASWDCIPLAPSPGCFDAFCAGDGLDANVTTPCPCGNFGAPGRGCANSANASGARLVATWGTSADTVVLHADGMPAVAPAIYLQSDGAADAPFGDGVRCLGGNLVRLRTRASAGGASQFPDSTDTVTLWQRGGVVPGSGTARSYQTYYRNAAALFCPPATFNITNGWRIAW